METLALVFFFLSLNSLQKNNNNITVPLLFLYSPIQNKWKMSLNIFTLSLMNSCSDGSSILASDPPEQHEWY